ncbi:hypothetical protein ABZ652_07230 [Micromonospora chalcea]|uniref:hypothetical protein n=1 Tax=Micromonospora chalcea TaxID=1874 RepID=UPI0033CCCB40
MTGDLAASSRSSTLGAGITTKPRILDYDDTAEMIAGWSGVSRDQWRDMVETLAGGLGDAHALHAS